MEALTSKMTIKTVSLKSELVADFLLYSTAIYNRALPDIVDGLKVAQRRAIVGMSDLRLRSTSPYCKVSRLEGHVLGRYHPQGGCAGTIINMGQQASMRYVLTDIHGNVGGSIQVGQAAGQLISEDGPAAARYLEVRSTPLCEYLYLDDLDRNLGDWRANYDDSATEPVRFVPPVPALLLTGAQGIASGYACSFTSFSVSDVIAATRAWIKNQNITDKQLRAKFTNPPESPQGGRINKSDKGISDIILTGKGSFTAYGEWETLNDLKWGKRSVRPALIVTKLASGSSEKFLERVRDLADADKLPGLLDAADQSSREGIRIVLVCKSVQDRDNLLRILIHSGTGLKHQHNINHVAVGADNKPRTVGVKEIIRQWYEHRVSYLISKYKSQSAKIQSEADKLEAVIKVLEDLEKFLNLVKKAKNKPDAIARVMGGWKLTEDLAKHVLSIPISTLISTEKAEVKSKYTQLIGQIDGLKSLCAKGPELDSHISDQIASLRGLCAPTRSVWMTESVLDTPQTQKPLTERDRIVSEGKEMGLSAMAINKWVKENMGKGGLIKRWESYKIEYETHL